jgi:CBS domain-containing protein
MTARDLISSDLPPLKVTDDVKKALEWMDDFKVSHLPVIDKTAYVGLVSDVELLDLNLSNDRIGKIKHLLGKPFVFDYQHAYDALKLYAIAKIDVIPVLDEKERYAGAITHVQMLNYFSVLTAAQEPGSIIILEISQHDYSLSQIAQIAESNGAKIVSLFLTPNHDSTLLEVTLKLNLQNAAPVIQTFERFGYNVKASFSQVNETGNLQERYDSLMHYLNM